MELFNKMIAAALKVSVHQVDNTLSLLDGGATIPFISRYRKEATGGLDEVQIGEIKDRNDKLCELAKRKETILSTIEEQGKLTEELRKRIEQSWDATEVEDIYLPYKPKRKTRAEAARQKGLEPLATLLLLQRENHLDSRLPAFVKGDVKDEEDALKGARDIIAEQVSEDERARNQLRNQFSRQAVITSKVVKGKEEEAAKYRDYFDFSEPLKRCSSHRLLAIRRGESEGLLKVSISPDDEECAGRLEQMYVRGNNECSRQVGEAVRDAYKRLLKPSIETEFSALSKEKADEEAIRVFAGNLRQLLLAPPLGQKRVMGVDPGYRTGCKIVCLDAQGSLLHNETIYPHPPKNEYSQAARSIVKLVEQYQIEAIAIGNGTASRETEQFITSQRYDRELQVFVVSEDGASIYSASKTARDEFPEYDVTVRGAVSIGRRLMDPLAELVKIDAKSIGVGQYQHDVDQTLLKKSLDQTVESCVNLVGVNLNTASRHLLTYISGLGPALAQNIVDYRTENGPFSSRKELLKVPRMGAKAFATGLYEVNVSSSLTVRSGPATTYPSVGQLSKGDRVVVDRLANGWAHLMDTSAGTSRYVSAGYLKRLSDYDGKTEPDEPFTTGWYRVKVESKLAVRASASSTAKKVGQLSANAEVVVDSLANGWAHLMDTSKGTGRYVSANYLTRVRGYSASEGEPNDPVEPPRTSQIDGKMTVIIDPGHGGSDVGACVLKN